MLVLQMPPTQHRTLLEVKSLVWPQHSQTGFNTFFNGWGLGIRVPVDLRALASRALNGVRISPPPSLFPAILNVVTSVYCEFCSGCPAPAGAQ